MYGDFSEEAKAVWDFVRCQRDDGTYYGSRGKCKKGKEVGAKEDEMRDAKFVSQMFEAYGYSGYSPSVVADFFENGSDDDSREGKEFRDKFIKQADSGEGTRQDTENMMWRMANAISGTYLMSPEIQKAQGQKWFEKAFEKTFDPDEGYDSDKLADLADRVAEKAGIDDLTEGENARLARSWIM